MNRKKWIVGISVVLVLLVGVFALSNASMSNKWLDGEKEPARLGTLVIPVTATGTIQANRLIQIKSKASGQVAKIHVVEGQMVNEGDVLVELDPVDEKRNVEARQAELDRAQSAHEKAKIALENQVRDLPLQTRVAQARFDDASARFRDAEFRWEKMKGYLKENVAGDVEGVSAESSYLMAKAARDLAETDLMRARNNEEILLKSARQDVVQAEAALRAAQKLVDEARLRLEDTIVRARSAGMVYNIMIREGEMIQSGTQSLTGGTPVMTLADVSAVLVMAQVDEADIGAIRKIAPDYATPGTSVKLTDEDYAARADQIVKSMEGKPVDVTVEAYRSQTYQGVIERILPEPQRVNNALAFNVRVRLVGDDLQKLIGLQADLSFTTEKIENALLVRNEALYSEGRECYVYVPVRNRATGRWDEKKLPVKIGATDGTYTEIVSGLKAGDEVWTRRPRKTEKEKQASENA